jgi:arylsulfatase
LPGGYPKFITQGFNEDYLPLWLQEGGINTYYVGKFANAHSVTNYLDPPCAGWTGSKYV